MGNYTAAVITISDKGFRGERTDTSGPALCGLARENGFEVTYTAMLPDEKEQIEAELLKCADELGVALVLTTGGTGFSPRDITPEAAKAVFERETPGIAEAMRAESMKITPRGCLSRSVAGIRKKTLIITLPGSEKAAKENLLAVMGSIRHGLDMLYSAGSAECAAPAAKPLKKPSPSMDAWLREAKRDPAAKECGMFLTHNGVVRESPRAKVREGVDCGKSVGKMYFSYDEAKVSAAVEEAKKLPGIYYVRAWLNEGVLDVGDDIMYVLVGGDIRPRVIDALQSLVGELKNHCVTETEVLE